MYIRCDWIRRMERANASSPHFHRVGREYSIKDQTLCRMFVAVTCRPAPAERCWLFSRRLDIRRMFGVLVWADLQVELQELGLPLRNALRTRRYLLFTPISPISYTIGGADISTRTFSP
jgi:hypothetical protein